MSEESPGGVLSLSQETDGKSVKDILVEEYLPALPLSPQALCTPLADSDFHPVLFDSITPDLVRSTTLRLPGGPGPSEIGCCRLVQTVYAFSLALYWYLHGHQ